MSRDWLSIPVAVLFCIAGCGGGKGKEDGGDAPSDTAGDAITLDAPGDAPEDAPNDSPSDAPEDVPGDSPLDVPSDNSDGGSADECDPFTTGSCEGEDTKCAVVLDPIDDENLDIYYACVPTSTGNKSRDVICSRGADVTPDDTEDDVQADDCGDGLFCWDDPNRSWLTCRQLCDAMESPCPDGHYCELINEDPPFGVCQPADECDAVTQDCDEGEGCYLIADPEGDLLTNCFEFVPPEDGGTGAPGDPCVFINNCEPGAHCFGEITDAGVSEETLCYAFCDTEAVDAGSDAGPDAGPDASLDAGTDASDGGAPCEPASCIPVPGAVSAVGLCQ